VTKHSRTSSVTKIGAIEFLNINLTDDPNKIITIDVYLPFDFGPAIGVTRATIFWHDRYFVWHQGDKEFLLSHGWNRISVNLPSNTSYPIRSVGIKLVSDLPITATFYIDHVMIGSSPDEDREPPQITIYNPLDNTEALSSKMFLSGTVQDNVGIYKCYFTLNGEKVSDLSIVDNVFNSEFSLIYGTNTIVVYAEDFSGNISSSSIKIYLLTPIDNPPNLFIINPTNNSSVSDIVPVNIEVNDDYGITKVEYYVDDQLKFVVSTSPYVWLWDTRSYQNGNYTLKIVAYDTSNQTKSSVLNVKVENLGEDKEPEVEIVTPTPMTEISGSFKINVIVNDERGISKVEYYINDGLIYTDTSGKKGLYEYEINSTNLRTGYQYLKIVAYDTTGNINSTQVIIYVYNKNKKEEFLLTPNNDGVNDIISFSNTTPVNIYDINGLLVKRIEDKNGYWDGKDKNGTIVSNGVYIFQIEGDISGTINVIK
jgi:gliding motility-associated-like protein